MLSSCFGGNVPFWPKRKRQQLSRHLDPQLILLMPLAHYCAAGAEAFLHYKRRLLEYLACKPHNRAEYR